MVEFPPLICPVCTYSLQGLAPPHRCPECGFEYDERTRVWRAPKRRFGWFDYVGPAVCVGLILYVILPMFHWRAGNIFHLASLGLVLLVLAWFVPTFMKQTRSRELGECVAVAPKGIFVRNSAGDEWIDWPAVGSVKFSAAFQYIQHAGCPRSTNLPGAFADSDERDAFIEAIRVARDHYLSQPAGDAA